MCVTGRPTAEFLASLLDNIPEQIVVLHPDTLEILHSNRTFQEFYGLSPDALIGKHCYEVTHRSTRPCSENGCACPVKTVLETGRTSAVVHEHADKHGNRRFFRLTASPVHDGDGRIVRVIETSRDITDMLELQEAYRKKSELFATILATSPDGIIGSDRKGNVFLYNSGAEQIYGYSRDEVIGKLNAAELYPPGGAREVKDFIYSEQYGGRGRLQDFETDVLAKGGRRVPIRISCALLFENGIEAGVIGFFHDISQRKALRQLLQESEETFRSIFESANDAILSIGPDGKILKANIAAERMLRYGMGELAGIGIGEILPGEYLDAWRRIHARSIEGKTSETKCLEVSARTRTGVEVPVHVSLSEGRSGGKAVITAIVRDISQRKALEEELRMLSITDTLTGLFNRRHFLSLARMEMERAVRTKVPFSILLFDIDRFKAYNDSYGHTEGDRLLAEVGELTRTTFRDMDSAFRFGGEEFVVLLPDTRRTGAMAAAERFRRRLAAAHFTPVGAGGPVTVTASIGVAEYQDTHTLDDVVRCADLAMYAAKKEGRNRVVLYDQLLQESPENTAAS
jgi:diguanylate cyclase (GGDEF)-like protein/PAS domain S-box-containing protein